MVACRGSHGVVLLREEEGGARRESDPPGGAAGQAWGMSRAHVGPGTLQIRFSRGQKLAGLRCDVDVSLADVQAVVVPVGLATTRGMRGPGLGLPGRSMIGTWRRRGARKTIVSVRRHRPALRVDLARGACGQLLLAVEDPDAVAQAIAKSR